MACIAVDIRSSFFVAVYAPLHINSINHFYRCITYPRKPMTNRAIDLALDMNPMRKDNKARKFIHPPPWNSLIRFHVSDNLYRLRPLTDGIAEMTGSTGFNIWDPCSTVFTHEPVTEKTVQLGYLLVVNMIETDRLVNVLTFQYWEGRENERFHRNSKTMPCNNGKKENQNESNEKAQEPFHILNLYWIRLQSVKKNQSQVKLTGH